MPLPRKELELAIAGGTATEQDFEGYTPENVLEIRQSLPACYRTLPSTALRVVDEEAKTIDLIFSIQARHRAGAIEMANPKDAARWGGRGWVTDGFDAGGSPYLFGHMSMYPTGTVESHRVELIDAPKWMIGPKRVWAFLGRVRMFDDPRLEFSQASWLLMQEGLTGSSTGFQGVVELLPTEEEREEFGLRPFDVLIAEQDLLEISHAVTPAVPGAVALAMDGSVERNVDAALRRFVEQKRLQEREAEAYRRAIPLGPVDAQQRLAARLRAVVPMRGVEWQDEHLPKLECIGPDCGFVGNPEEVVLAVDDKTAGTCSARGTPDGEKPAGCGCGGTEARALLERLTKVVGAKDVAALEAEVERLLDDEEPGVLTPRARALLENAFETASEFTEKMRELLDVLDDEETSETDLNLDGSSRNVNPDRDEPSVGSPAPVSAEHAQQLRSDVGRSDIGEPVGDDSRPDSRSSGTGGAGDESAAPVENHSVDVPTEWARDLQRHLAGQ